MPQLKPKNATSLTSIAIIGKGRLGTSICQAIKKTAGPYQLHSFLSSRSSSFKELGVNGGPQVLIIATKDDAIADVAKKAVAHAGKNLQLIVHLAGSLPSTILPEHRGVPRLTLHPIQTFAKPDAWLFSSITVMASSHEKRALDWAKQFTRSLGARDVLILNDEVLPLYHAMVVFASNATILLGAVVEELSSAIGEPPTKIKKAITPLMRQAQKNVLQKSAKDVLTGPIKRNDLATIKKHQKALKQVSPEIAALYDVFLKVAKKYVV